MSTETASSFGEVREKDFKLTEVHFGSRVEMISGLEKLRSSTDGEFMGIINHGEEGYSLSYMNSQSRSGGEIPPELMFMGQGVWHSHPDSSVAVDEMSSARELVKEQEGSVRATLEKTLDIYSGIDDQSSEKISVTDIITAVSFPQEFYLSLPCGFLEIKYYEAKEDSPINNFAENFSNFQIDLMSEIDNSGAKDGEREDMINYAKIKAYAFAFESFEEMLFSVGETRLDKDNWRRVLEKIGLPYALETVPPEAV